MVENPHFSSWKNGGESCPWSLPPLASRLMEIGLWRASSGDDSAMNHGAFNSTNVLFLQFLNAGLFRLRGSAWWSMAKTNKLLKLKLKWSHGRLDCARAGQKNVLCFHRVGKQQNCAGKKPHFWKPAAGFIVRMQDRKMHFVFTGGGRTQPWKQSRIFRKP